MIQPYHSWISKQKTLSILHYVIALMTTSIIFIRTKLWDQHRCPSRDEQIIGESEPSGFSPSAQQLGRVSCSVLILLALTTCSTKVCRYSVFFRLVSLTTLATKEPILLLIPFIRNHRYQLNRARSLRINLYRLKIHLLESSVSRKPSHTSVYLFVLFLRDWLWMSLKRSSVKFQFLLPLCVYVKVIWDFFPPLPFSQS